MNEIWTWNDGWILMSIYMASHHGSAELSRIIATADATNHAIPTKRELSSAFTKLMQYGVINIKENKYEIESSFAQGIEKAYNSKGGLFESANKGKKWLKKSKLSCLNDTKIQITEEQLSLAYGEYTSSLKKK